MNESKLRHQHTGALQEAVICGSNRVFSGFDPNYIERDSRKRKFIDGIRDLTARRWDSPKSWHGVRYWERKRHSGNSGIVEVRDVGLS